MDNATAKTPQGLYERRMPRHIRRSLFCLSIDDPQLGDKAYASWADAIVLDFVKAPGRDWQHDLRSKMPAAIDAAARGGAEVFVRLESAGAAAALESVAFAGLAGIVMKGVSGAPEITEVSARLDTLERSR